MQNCFQCHGLIPSRMKQCPHCETIVKKSGFWALKRAVQLVMGASVSMTLSACYGAPVGCISDPSASPKDGKTPNGSLPPCPNGVSSSPLPEPTPSTTPSPSAQTEK